MATSYYFYHWRRWVLSRPFEQDVLGAMRVFYLVKAAMLFLALLCLAFILRSKPLCAYRKPHGSQMDCHSSLIDSVFSPAEANMTANTSIKGVDLTAELEKTPPFRLRSCIRIYERDIYVQPSELTPLAPLLVPVCLLVVEMFLIVFQMAKVMTSHDVPDRLSAILTAVLHGVCWIGTGLTFLLLSLNWHSEWTRKSPHFVPRFPDDYMYPVLIAAIAVVVTIYEATLYRTFVYYDLRVETDDQEHEKRPSQFVAVFRDTDNLLTAGENKN